MLWTLLVIAATAYAGVAAVLFVFQERFVYFPSAALEADPRAAGLDFDEVRLHASDGVALHGWFVPARERRATALFLHGNAGNVSHRLDTLLVLHRLGLDTLIVDYRGYGASAGRPTEAGTYRDAEAAWRHLTAERGIPAHQILVFGRSLGGAVAAWLASEVTPGALVVEATFTSVPALGARIYPWLPVRLLARIRYDSLARIGRVRCPVLVAHAREDEVVPFEHGRALHAGAPGAPRFLELDGGHNDGFVVTGARYAEALSEFLTAAGLPAAHPAPSSDGGRRARMDTDEQR